MIKYVIVPSILLAAVFGLFLYLAFVFIAQDWSWFNGQSRDHTMGRTFFVIFVAVAWVCFCLQHYDKNRKHYRC